MHALGGRRLVLFEGLLPLVLLAGVTASEEQDCAIYLAYEDEGPLSLFSGVSHPPHSRIGGDTQELVLPIPQPNKNEFSPWHDFVWEQSYSQVLPEMILRSAAGLDHAVQDVFVSGIGAMASCSGNPNLVPRHEELQVTEDDGSTSRIRNFHFGTTDAGLEAGQVLSVTCSTFDDEDTDKRVMPLAKLKNQGVCLDMLEVRESNVVSGGGRGAFAKHTFQAGQVVTTSPVLHMDRSQFDIVVQEHKEQHMIPLSRPHGIEYQATKVLGHQLMENYCYGSPDSDIVLLPMGLGVNFINHGNGGKKPNVQLRWSDFTNYKKVLEEHSVMQFLEQKAGNLFVEYVALHDIANGEEILLDYGPEWEQAWNNRDPNQPFRHVIGVPEGFYPQNWNKLDPEPFGDFGGAPLKPGEIGQIRWKGSNKLVTPWAFRIGLSPAVREILLEYCNLMGITDILRHVTLEGNGLEPGTEVHMSIHGDDWYLQRPQKKWRSNLHWFSPGDAPAHEHYLQALSVAGFDEVLESIGEQLNMDGLVAFHVTFIGVTHSTEGYIHHDVIETDGKVYNVIIPLILANETGPELDLEDYDEEGRVGRYRYVYGEASMMGDDADHATSACDYRETKEMRMAATVYIADVNENNIKSILRHYTQAYPPRDIKLLRRWIGRHWKKGDASRTLPKPTESHVLYNYPNHQKAAAAGDEL